MSNLLNSKLLAVAVLLLASIAGSLAYRNAKEAAKEADAARSRVALLVWRVAFCATSRD